MALIFEVIRATVIGIVFFYLFFKSRNTMLFEQSGWVMFLTGFGLLFLGTVVDVSDEFPELSFLAILGQTEIQAFVEKIIGYTVGGVLIFLGSVRFIPTMLEDLLMKEELKKVNEELEDKVKERTVELEKANSVKNEFISMMSHEIRTPLNAIKGMTYHLRNSKLDQNQLKRISSIDLSADLLLSIFNNILYYIETESGKVKITQISYSLKEVIQQLFNSYVGIISEKNMHFIAKSEGNIPDIINGDPEILKRILMIFVENAVKYSEKGKIEIISKVVKHKENKSMISISVEDTGIGISDEKINLITQIFSQSEEISTRKFGGIGLGLAIVGRLSELTKGELKVESTRNVGSKFTALLPCVIKSESGKNFYFDNTSILKEENKNENVDGISNEEILKINESFAILQSLLEQYDSDALNIVEQIITDYGFEIKFKDLRNAIQNYNFEEALTILNRLKENLNH